MKDGPMDTGAQEAHTPRPLILPEVRGRQVMGQDQGLRCKELGFFLGTGSLMSLSGRPTILIHVDTIC